jgi:hypothetical protein
MMHVWILVPWLVFAVAAGTKFWRLTTVFRRQPLDASRRTEIFRRALEQTWQRDQRTS